MYIHLGQTFSAQTTAHITGRGRSATPTQYPIALAVRRKDKRRGHARGINIIRQRKIKCTVQRRGKKISAFSHTSFTLTVPPCSSPCLTTHVTGGPKKRADRQQPNRARPLGRGASAQKERKKRLRRAYTARRRNIKEGVSQLLK